MSNPAEEEAKAPGLKRQTSKVVEFEDEENDNAKSADEKEVDSVDTESFELIDAK